MRLLRQLATKRKIWAVFSDFLALSALAISNAVDLRQFDEREAQYMEIVGRYNKSEIKLFAELFAHLTLELDEHAEQPRDVLGEIFHELMLK